MAEYKYRALGWKDDDIASLKVVDGTAADNQVELQITKQGAGGTIDGPAIVGKDGITINKAADSEKIEISGSECVPKLTPGGATLVYAKYSDGRDGSIVVNENFTGAQTLPTRNLNGELIAETSAKAVDKTLTNKKYVDDNYVKKVTTSSPYTRAYTVDAEGKIQGTIDIDYSNESGAQRLIRRDSYGAIYVPDSSIGKTNYNFPSGQEAVNKKYVDNADKDLRLKLSNLEQALNGYILDTTEESYADLDSAVLKNSVAVGDNVYPIADKTRALVTRIEGKTTKMVQLLDKSKFPATSTSNGVTFTNNGDGTITVNGTVTKNNHALILIQGDIECIANHKYCIMGCPEGGLAGRSYGISVQAPGQPIVWDEGKGNIFNFDSHITIELYLNFYTNNATYTNKVATPQLFDLTAMNREDITTVEQFKAEFPDLYPYENGNIYPAKISGVKFTGKNLFNPSTPKYSGESKFELDGNNIIVRQSSKSTYISANFELPNAKFLIGKKLSISAKVKTSDNNQGLIRVIWMRGNAAVNVSGMNIISNTGTGKTETNLSGSGIVLAPPNDVVKLCLLLYSNTEGNLSETKTYTATYSNIQVEISDAPTAYEPYTEPVSVTLPETYDLHGIGNYKDYLEITKNENNELYTLKKVQVIDKHVFDGTEAWIVSGRVLPICQAFYTMAVLCLFVYDGKGGLSNHLPLGFWDEDIEHIQFGQGNPVTYLFLNKEKFKTGSDVQEYLAAQYASGNPLIAYYILPTPVETVVATNLTYEQVTAIRHNGGLIEVEDNTNKGYARPTVTNTIVYKIPNKLDKQTAQTESDQVYGKLADGSQTMFDVTVGATATTIPRRDAAGRIQVADGVSGNDAVNFNQLSAQKEALEAELNNKQATLVSGTNIKTINGNSLLGSGDLTIAGGGSGVDIVQITGQSTTAVMSQKATTDEIAALKSDLVDLEERTTKIDGLKTFKLSDYELQVGYESGGSIQNDANWRYAFIDISNYNEITLSINEISDTANGSFYNENNVFIRRAIPDWSSSGVYELDVPDNAKFLALSSKQQDVDKLLISANNKNSIKSQVLNNTKNIDVTMAKIDGKSKTFRMLDIGENFNGYYNGTIGFVQSDSYRTVYVETKNITEIEVLNNSSSSNNSFTITVLDSNKLVLKPLYTWVSGVGGISVNLNDIGYLDNIYYIAVSQHNNFVESSTITIKYKDIYANRQDEVNLIDSKKSSASYSRMFTENIGFIKALHLDCGRKYFSIANIKRIIDTCATAKLNTLQLYFSDDHSFRLALDDMMFTVYGQQYNLANALGTDGKADNCEKWYSQSEMTSIINYAKSKGIEIIPAFDMPGHSGRIRNQLNVSPTSKLGRKVFADILARYVEYFSTQGCRFFNICGDETSTWLDSSAYNEVIYTSMNIISNKNMIPLIYNDYVCKYDSINYGALVLHWSMNGNAKTVLDVQKGGYRVINSTGSYYWVLGQTTTTDEYIESLRNSNIFLMSDRTYNYDICGAFYSIWCDDADHDGADEGNAVVANTESCILAFGEAVNRAVPEKYLSVMYSPNGSAFRIQVSNEGVLSATML